jgi:protein phosphatase
MQPSRLPRSPHVTASVVATHVVDRPDDDQIDIHGVTHAGLVRQENQDHFLIGALTRHAEVRQTSLPHGTDWPADERIGWLAMVADGVGGGEAGEEASRLAVARATDLVNHGIRCLFEAGAGNATRSLADQLVRAAHQVHADITRAAAEKGVRGMATTLTLWLGIWPHAYLLQVGDSRCYILRGETLTQLSRDQTIAQQLVDQGGLDPAVAAGTPWAHVLYSAIGGGEADPVVTTFDMELDNVGLLCSDGLTKHVSDERIRDRLRTMTSARQACEALLQDALDGGGTDNITIVVGRANRRRRRPA